MIKLKMVVFDMAGTTVDEGKIVYQSVKESLNHVGVHYALDDVYQQIGGMNKKEGIRKLLSMSQEKVDDSLVDSVTNDFLRIVEDKYRTNKEVVEMAGAGDLFRNLKMLGIKVVLDTGYFRRTADILIDKMEWNTNGLIDYSVTSDEVSEGRPSSMMIRKAMKHFGIDEPLSVAKVGDTPTDMEEGVNAGCGLIIGITGTEAESQKLLKAGAHHVVQHLGEVLDLVNY